jgi:hypothetical protein
MDDEFEYGGRSWAVEAEVGVLTMLTFNDIAPVLTELNERIGVVRGKRTDSTPPMAADPDLAVHLMLLVAAVGGVEALRKLVGLLTEDLYKGIRASLLALVRKANARDNSRPWNLGITVGSHHFYFSGPADEEELLRGLRAMKWLVDESPDGLVDGTQKLPPEPGGSGWYWHADKGLWVPTPAVVTLMANASQGNEDAAR